MGHSWQELEIKNPLSVFCGSCWTSCPTPPKQPAAPSLVWPPSHSASTTSLARRSPTSWALSPRKTIEEKKRTRKSGSPMESPSSHLSVSLGEGQWLFVVRILLVVCLFVCCWGRVEVGGMDIICGKEETCLLWWTVYLAFQWVWGEGRGEECLGSKRNRSCVVSTHWLTSPVRVHLSL